MHFPAHFPFRLPQITNHYDDNLLPCFNAVLPRLPRLAALNLSNFEINNNLLAAVRKRVGGRVSCPVHTLQ